jgi:hypothetical protein
MPLTSRKRRGKKTGARKNAAAAGPRARKRPTAAKARRRRPVAVLRAMSDLSDAQKRKVFVAVQETLRAHQVGNTLAELHFATDELDLVCGDGEVRRMVAFPCGAGVCTKNVCVPLNS